MSGAIVDTIADHGDFGMSRLQCFDFVAFSFGLMPARTSSMPIVLAIACAVRAYRR